MPWRSRIVKLLEHSPYIVTRHPAWRRQRLFTRAGVDLVIDVGAATGAYAATLRAFGFGGRIASFEPMAAPFAELQRRAATDPAWTVHRSALGSEAGTAEITVAGDSSSLLPMLDAHRRAAPDVVATGTETVAVARLDDLADELLAGSRAPFLKIDTQGFERQVLRGAERTVPKLVGLQLELSFVELYAGTMLVDEAIAWAYREGFVLAGVERGFIAPSGEALQADGIFLRGTAPSH